MMSGTDLASVCATSRFLIPSPLHAPPPNVTATKILGRYPSDLRGGWTPVFCGEIKCHLPYSPS
eukprot:3467816-Rhodomonas_salina.1